MNRLTQLKKRLQWAWAPQRDKRQLMESAITLLHFDADAAEMLRMAREDGVEIRFSAKLTGSKTAAHFVMSAQRSYIEVCPYADSGELNRPESIASSLAHELRHYWQYKMMGITPENRSHINRSPRLSFIFNRVVEADAYAFQRKFVKTLGETADAFTAYMKEIPHPTPLQAHIINIETGGKLQKLRAGDAQYLRQQFLEMLERETLSVNYDPDKVRHLHLFHTSRYADGRDFEKVKGIPEMTVADIRSLLRARVGKNAPAYLEEMADGQFEELVLGHAHKGALEAVNLMEQFRRAVAANDNAAASSLRRRVRDKIHKL